jgi:cytoskeletal protein CcmA (bactofilin family)
MFRMGKNPREENAEKPTTATGQPQAAAAARPTPPAPLNQETPAVNQRPEKSGQAQRAFTEAESLAHEIKEGVMSGFVGGSTSLNGQATFKDMLRVDGHLSGTITSEKGTLIVSSGGQVNANIEVAVARINGTVKGDIIATELIELGRTARLDGDIHTPALLIEPGAIFEGNCRMTARTPAAPFKQPGQTIKDKPPARTESQYLPAPHHATREPDIRETTNHAVKA